ncbi:hypothetical protein GCM10011412_33520 [Maribacter cobaltidurans]|nr:hypothetical protein GCM10011412_33520 [Maribacter cobaltidurans]
MGKLRLNEIQVIGSHNSYKIAIEKPLWNYLFQQDYMMARSLQYEHLTLTEQLELGLRNLELDVFHDPKGGYYKYPAGLEIVKASGKKPLPFDVANKLDEPGLKVFHVQDIDFRSHQLLFKDALKELLVWSGEHPEHIPIIITLNTKDGKISRLRDPLTFDADALIQLDLEIRDVLSEEKLITPDLVRGNSTSLEKAILGRGWPRLEKVRGRFLFVLDEGDEKGNLYLQKFPELKNAVLFLNKQEGSPEAAFRIINDPVANFEKIRALVEKGNLVRTRADAGTFEARENDYSRFEKAKSSGAQIITTDYYMPSTLFESNFKVDFGEGVYERVGN